MQIRESARKHGITDDEINHALDHAIRVIEFEYDGEDRVIHADRLRASLFDYLR